MPQLECNGETKLPDFSEPKQDSVVFSFQTYVVHFLLTICPKNTHPNKLSCKAGIYQNSVASRKYNLQGVSTSMNVES